MDDRSRNASGAVVTTGQACRTTIHSPSPSSGATPGRMLCIGAFEKQQRCALVVNLRLLGPENLT